MCEGKTGQHAFKDNIYFHQYNEQQKKTLTNINKIVSNRKTRSARVFVSLG